jgi:transposase
MKNYITHKNFIRNTIDYLRYLLNEFGDQRLVIFWDGATYHRSKEIRGLLEKVNQTLPFDEWKIHCER